MRRVTSQLLIALVALSAALLPAAAQQARAEGQFDTRLVTNFSVGGTDNGKFPDIVGAGSRAFMSVNPGSGDNHSSNAFNKGDSEGSFPENIGLGDTKGKADYSSVSIGANPQGTTVGAAWVTQDGRSTISYRSRAINGAWGERFTVTTGGGGFRVNPQVTIAANGRVFVIYKEGDYARFKYSDNGGQSWSGAQDVSRIAVLIGYPQLASGANGTVAAVYGGGNGHIYAGIWNEANRSFDISQVTTKSSSREYYLTPTIAVDPFGKVYVAWRAEYDSSSGRSVSAVYYSERQPNGTWPRSTLTNAGPIRDAPPIASDSKGNISIYWLSSAGGSAQIYYSFKPYNQAFQSVLVVPGPGGALFNGAGSANISNRAYGHFVVEQFGSKLTTRYYLFSSRAESCDIGTGTFTLNPTNVVDTPNGRVTNQVSFNGTLTPGSSCSANRVILSYNAQDNNAARVAIAPGQTAVVPLTIPVSAQDQCAQTIYARYLKNDGTTESFVSDWFAATIRVDAANPPDGNAIDADVRVFNRNTSELSRWSPGIADMQTGGASDGHPSFTRDKQVGLNVRDTGECSGLVSLTGLGFSNQTITGGSFSSLLGTIGDSANPGLITTTASIGDRALNIGQFTRRIVYDPPLDGTPGAYDGAGRPKLNDATLGEANLPTEARKSIIRTLVFSDVNVTDNLYNKNYLPSVSDNLNFWGVWVAVEYAGSPTAALAPADPNSAALVWTPIKVDTSSKNFTAKINLFTSGGFGLTSEKSGAYRVYVRFLDGAGNASSGSRSTTVTLDPGYQLPQIALPVVST